MGDPSSDRAKPWTERRLKITFRRFWSEFRPLSFSLEQNYTLEDDYPILCFLVFDTFKLSMGGRTLVGRRFSAFSSFAVMERFVFNNREIVQ